MTRAEVTRLAHEHGYNDSERSWLTRTVTRGSTQSKELSLVDLSFRGGRLVAFKEGKYVPKSKRVEYHSVNLCEPAP